MANINHLLGSTLGNSNYDFDIIGDCIVKTIEFEKGRAPSIRWLVNRVKITCLIHDVSFWWSHNQTGYLGVCKHNTPIYLHIRSHKGVIYAEIQLHNGENVRI